MKIIPRSVLFVSYPMLPVSNASCGGAEQMLWVLEHELANRGMKSAVAACDGSCVTGELIATGAAPEQSDAFEFRAAEHRWRIEQVLQNRSFDLVHDKSGFWWENARTSSAPVLATLHLPRSFYPERLFRYIPPNVFFNCVSESQAQAFQDLPRFVGVVPNGIVVERFLFMRRKHDYVLWLGRICPEKAPHLAIDAAERAGVPLVLAGQVYPFDWHRQYFEREIRPRLDRACRNLKWVERPSFDQKIDLIRHARAVLLSTQAPETSSLVAMEAAACGTPVIAFANGAIPEIVRHGVTGFLVRDWKEMADAIADVEQLWPEDGRVIAEQEFSSRRMADKYCRVYAEIADEAEQCRKFAT
jgi:glycosyltransferase involved in cell wall biosynthesis